MSKKKTESGLSGAKDMSNLDNHIIKKNDRSQVKARPFSEIPQYYRHLRTEIVSVVPENALKILDVGCGAGILGKALKEKKAARYVVGIELDTEAFHYAKTNIDLAYNVELEAFNPPFMQGEFDCIIFGDILEHLKDPWKITCLYATFLKPNGIMIASIPNIRHLPTLRKLAELGSWEYQDEGILDRTHLRFFTKKDFHKLLNQANIICDSVYYLGGQELHSLRPQEPDRIVRLGNFALLNVTDEDFLELCAHQLLFVGTHKAKNHLNIDDTLTSNFSEKTIEDNQIKTNSVSLVVPWWDHSELLEVWKRNLEHFKNIEVIFIDNGSQPQAKLELEKFCTHNNIKLIRNEENRGFSAANNQGAELATGEYILHLNNDVEILNFPVQSLCSLAGYGIAGYGLIQSELGAVYLEGWALCIKKSTLEALGGWSEDYGLGYWDDVDICHRARLAGYPLTPIPDIKKWMRHKANTTGRDGRINQLGLHIHNRGVFIQKHYSIHPKIVVDGVFFQLYKTGIARVWKSLLEEWANNGFAQYIIVLDRAGTAPKIPGIRYRFIPGYDYGKTDSDREILQTVCDEEGADLFISTYYTTPISTPSVFMAYDMIPEVMEWNINQPMWREKHEAIKHASSYMAISENTAHDLVRVFPDIALESVAVALCGVKNLFSPASPEEVNSFRTKYGVSKPYFLIVGTGGYKNTILFLQAFAQLSNKHGFDILCTGTGEVFEDTFRTYTSGSTVYMLRLTDEELRCAYSGATALVYPSKYEGFGLPVLEALACGCPVITCLNASIPEVAGKAALYIKDDDVDELTNALCDVQKPSIRNSLIIAGLQQAKQFSWSKMANIVSSTLIDTTLLPLKLKEINLIIFPDWSQPEELIGLNVEKVMRMLANDPDSKRMTLLIDTSNIPYEEAELLLSAITMNLLMQEDLDVTDDLEISLVGDLADIQWETLLRRLQARIVMEHENKQVIARIKAENLSATNLS